MSARDDDLIDAYQAGKDGLPFVSVTDAYRVRQIRRDPHGPRVINGRTEAKLCDAWQKGNDVFVKACRRGARR